MKIDGNRPAHDPSATENTRRSTLDPHVRQGGVQAPGTPTDRVELSSDAALRTAALKAATEAPEIRPDLVDRMREKLESGTLGADSLKLADAIIDELLQ